MSLETVIAENTSALRDLLAAIQGGALITPPEASGKKPSRTAAEKPERTADSASTAQAAASASTRKPDGTSQSSADSQGADAGNAQPDAAAQTGASAAIDTTVQSAQTGAAVTYQAAADAVTKLARTKGRDAAIGVLKSFGVEKLPEVKADQYAAVVTACAKAMEG